MKFFTPLKIIFLLEFFVVFLISIGILPRETALFLTGILLFYLIFADLEDSLILLVVSIPLYIALPITESFDSMASWRVLIGIVFLVWMIKSFRTLILPNVRKFIKNWKELFLTSSLARFLALSFIFFSIGLLSLVGASDFTAGIKKILFLGNIFLFLILIAGIAQTRENLLRIIKAAAVAGGITIFAGFLQLVVVFKWPLYVFWQFWAVNVSQTFYGKALSELLSYSNTWFSYYEVAPPTLRLFSIMPDSHSFAMMAILSAPLFLVLAFHYQSQRKLKARRRRLAFSCLILSILAIVLSGSRGAWLSIIFPLAILIFLFYRRVERKLIKTTLFSVSLFFLMFIVSSFYPPLLYKFQSLQGDSAYVSESLGFFERAKSISDITEMSNKGRLEIWRRTIGSVSERPLLGVGIGNFPVVLEEDISSVKRGASAHNLYFDIASEMGIIGLLVFLLLILEILRTSYSVFRKSPDNLFKLFAMAFGVYAIWIFTYSFFDVTLFNDKVLMIFMVEVGVLYVMDFTFLNHRD